MFDHYKCYSTEKNGCLSLNDGALTSNTNWFNFREVNIEEILKGLKLLT